MSIAPDRPYCGTVAIEGGYLAAVRSAERVIPRSADRSRLARSFAGRYLNERAFCKPGKRSRRINENGKRKNSTTTPRHVELACGMVRPNVLDAERCWAAASAGAKRARSTNTSTKVRVWPCGHGHVVPRGKADGRLRARKRPRAGMTRQPAAAGGPPRATLGASRRILSGLSRWCGPSERRCKSRGAAAPSVRGAAACRPSCQPEWHAATAGDTEHRSAR